MLLVCRCYMPFSHFNHNLALTGKPVLCKYFFVIVLGSVKWGGGRVMDGALALEMVW